MKILVIADEESKVLWDYYDKKKLEDVDLIISCGDLKPEYLSFLVTMKTVPLLYVHGNHDDKYETRPPLGCTSIEDDLFEYRGVRIVGLGGSMRYNNGHNQYDDYEMRKRIRKLAPKIRRHGGVDIIVTHAPARGINDGDDPTHRGFVGFAEMIEEYKPKYFLHGHVHLSYGREFKREIDLGETKVINAYEKYFIEIEDRPEAPKKWWQKFLHR